MKLTSFLPFILAAGITEAKTFQNSYVSFEVPENWNCLQEGMAWTCTPAGPVASKEAVIVLAAKVAGPEDNLINFLTYLKEPKKIKTRVGTPMPSQVMYAQQRALAGTTWVQAQHLGSEIQEYYTLYLATVKDQLAMLISFSSEKTKYQVYNPVFDRAIKSLKIVASQQLLFARNQKAAATETFGIQAPGAASPALSDDLLPAPEKSGRLPLPAIIGLAILILGASAWYFRWRQKKTASRANKKARPK